MTTETKTDDKAPQDAPEATKPPEGADAQAKPPETPPAPPAPVTPPPKKEPAQVRAGAAVKGLIPQTIEEAARIAQGIFQSGMTPSTYEVKTKFRDDKGNEVEQVDAQSTTARLLIGIMKGMEVGLPPITAISFIVVVNNRPSIWGDGALGLIQNSGRYEWHREFLEGDPKKENWTAVCQFKRVGNPEVIERRFTWAQALAAKLTEKYNSPWKTYPERMLQMRARSWAMRDGFSDVLSGLSIAEEVRDFDITAAAEAPKPEIQQDKFTMKALENKPAEAVNFDLMNKKPAADPVPAAKDNAQNVATHELTAEPKVMTATEAKAGQEDAEKKLGEKYGELQGALLQPLADKALDIVKRAEVGDPDYKVPYMDEPQPKQGDLLGLPPIPEETKLPDCRACNGHGVSSADDSQPCPVCGGTGVEH